MRNFEMTCYYVASNLPAQFGAEQAAGADIADNAEFENCESYLGFSKSFLFRRVAQG